MPPGRQTDATSSLVATEIFSWLDLMAHSRESYFPYAAQSNFPDKAPTARACDSRCRTRCTAGDPCGRQVPMALTLIPSLLVGRALLPSGARESTTAIGLLMESSLSSGPVATGFRACG